MPKIQQKSLLQSVNKVYHLHRQGKYLFFKIELRQHKSILSGNVTH